MSATGTSKALLLLFLCCLQAWSTSEEATSPQDWKRGNAWPNDSVAITRDNILEIHRDLTDLWLATRDIDTPGLFSALAQYHGFLILSGQLPANAFRAFPKAEEVRLVMRFKRSIREEYVEAVTIGVRARTYASPRFAALTRMLKAKPKRYLQLCRQRFDTVRVNKDAEETK